MNQKILVTAVLLLLLASCTIQPKFIVFNNAEETITVSFADDTYRIKSIKLLLSLAQTALLYSWFRIWLTRGIASELRWVATAMRSYEPRNVLAETAYQTIII